MHFYYKADSESVKKNPHVEVGLLYAVIYNSSQRKKIVNLQKVFIINPREFYLSCVFSIHFIKCLGFCSYVT